MARDSQRGRNWQDPSGFWYTWHMNTLLATNIILAVIGACTLVLTVLLAVFLTHSIEIARKVKYIVKTFDDDVHRSRSVIIAVKDLVLERIGLSPKKHHAHTEK